MIKKILYMLILIFVFLLFPIKINLSNPYMAGYFNYSSNPVLNTTKALVVINYQNTQPNQIPSGNFLGGVLSVAGANENGVPTGWIFQNGVGIYSNSTAVWAPQGWYGGQLRHNTNVNVGYYNYPAYYVRMDTTTTKIQYKIYIYSSYFDLEHDYPQYYMWERDLLNNTKKFLVGKQLNNGIYYKHLQFGVESPSTITNSWELLNNKPCYFDGIGWSYRNGNVTWGTTSYITWINTTPYMIGGQTYNGVNISYSYNDTVCWRYTGTTISDNAQLWSGSGTVSDVVSRPYEP